MPNTHAPIRILETEDGQHYVQIRGQNFEIMHHSQPLGTRQTAENNVRATIRAGLIQFLLTARDMGWKQAASALECEAELAELHGLIADDVLKTIREIEK